MSSLTLSPTFNKNKVFILHKSELNKRLDPFYYVPSLVELERKILAKHPKKLRDYVVSLSSGATPKTTESEKYYSEKENGIPFLRVQNLSPTGVLEFEDCKYINKKTHENYLKRSQVFENDLLIKITGVGRMAVASVAPENFEGNINQHIVVIRTKDKETSETRSSFMTYTAKAAMRNRKGKRNTVLPNSQRKTENRKLPAVPAFSKNAKTNMTAKAKKKTPQSIRTPFSGREKWKGRLGRNAPFLCLPFLLCITPLYPRTKTFSTAKLLLHPNFTPRGCTMVYTI